MWRRKKEMSQEPKNHRAIYAVSILLIGLVFLGRSYPVIQDPTYVPLIIAGQEHYLEYAARNSEHRRGLQLRPSIFPNGGILMDLPDGRAPELTTEELNFPITALTLSEDLEILELVHLQPRESHILERDCRYAVQIPLTPDLQVGDRLRSFEPDAALRLSLISLNQGGH